MSRSHRRGPWVAEEDATLLSLVASRGPNNWVQISQHMHYRSPKQCRERYHQNLKASLNHDPISSEEGELIEQMVTEMGKKWAEIARRLGNRSDNAVKNWWNGSQNRRKRNVPHHRLSSKTLTNRSQPFSAIRQPSSSGQQDARRRNYGEQSAAYSQGWHDLRPPDLGHRRPFRDHQAQAVHQAYRHERSQSHVHRVQGFRDNGYDGWGEAKQRSPPPLHRFDPDDHIGHLLPSLGPIDTRQLPPTMTPHTIQPPHSATSMDRAPSLVSDHNSNNSISPKTWPSPRPEVPTHIESTRSRWPEQTLGNRRGSAPTISKLVSLPFTGDEGYVSAIPPSASSERKYILPMPVGRPASFEGQSSDSHGDHRDHRDHRDPVPNPEIRPSASVGSNSNAKNASSTRDTRMNFSSLLN